MALLPFAMNDNIAAALGAVIVAVVLSTQIRRAGDLIKDIPGPPSPSWLFGNLLEIILEVPYGILEFQWQKQFGPVYRTKGCFGENRLMISDPTTLKHILSNPGKYMKSPQQQLINETGLGSGSLLFVEGEMHRRIRGVMNPAFSAASIRELSPTLRKAASEVSERWETLLDSQDSNGVIDIYQSLHDTTLQAVGEGVVGYNFQADKDFAQRYQSLVLIAADRSKTSILTDGILPYIPKPVLNVLMRFPPPALVKLLEFKSAIGVLANTLVKEKVDALELGIEPEKDLISVLVGSNSQAESKMTFDEIRDQFPTITVAGEDTTANTVAWCLYELAKNPEYQQQLRTEVDQVGGGENTDYDRLPMLNALIKEVLRLYSTVPQTERVCVKDSVLPLAEPITTKSGEIIMEIPIKKGQHLVLAISSYHRLNSVWGDDAAEFKPSRWLGEQPPAAGASIGPYANLLSFLGGSRTCIGWRFSLAEMQIIISELVRKFSFALTDEGEVTPTFAITLVPMAVDGSGAKLPLRVARLQ
ncbi:Cytochrome P450 [Mycena indigotica]|uniref:Cytochrome P450 n=1 Tax=Mycena indigotica TaxID=2126181 RepID=A0A8H6VQG2_9AGAR|nr:Cytochrome P450 [Mycena indigotica]KAF7289934.1 Cytochrome P450 [Mycena indigotica]